MRRWHITLFGGIQVDIEEDGAIRPALVEPSRLALLAYLATEATGRFRTRDSILALLWPDRPERQARLALRQALYHLNTRLGPGLIVRRGHQRLSLDAERVSCDVHRFETALIEGRFRDALAEYRADFLEGFFLTSQPDSFEEWTRVTRLRLLDGAISAVTAMSEGDFGEPEDHRFRLGWVHRALALSPYSESLLSRAVDLRLQRGDRGGALHEVDKFSSRLRREIGLGDSRLVAGMRVRAASRGHGTAGRSAREIRLPADGLRVELEEILSGRLDRVERVVAAGGDGDPAPALRVVVERGEEGDGDAIATVRIEEADA
jgi:DNA-binding SARP family transcriptional activator